MECPRLRALVCAALGRHRPGEPDGVVTTPAGPMLLSRCPRCGSMIFHAPGDLTSADLAALVQWLEG